MNLRRIALACALTVAVTTGRAAADVRTDAAFKEPPPAASILDDRQLESLRGRFVPSATSALDSQIVYFGLELATTWKTANAATYVAGQRIGFDLSGPRPVITISSFGSRSGDASMLPSSGTVAGSALNSGITGVTQAVQIAGNGNSAANTASIDILTARPVFAGSTLDVSTCGTACTYATGPQGFGVGIALPGGSASQGIGSGGVFQNIQIGSSGNLVSNQLGMTLQVTPPGGGRISIPSTPLLVPPVPFMGGH
ncbi:MAG: hypothetical protein NVSMB5_05670 [Candidatus Velthaea sp.]